MKTTILITTPKGLAPFLRSEIEALKYEIVWAGTTGFEIEGSFVDAMKLNLHLRTAHHVMYLLKRFSCSDPQELYRVVKSIPWETMISPQGYISITSNVSHPSIRDSRFANMKCKDAVVDRIAERKGQRPNSGPQKDGAVIHLFWHNDHARIYLDTSGESLSKRGYRKYPLFAPMQETLAAGVIMATGWKNGENFINPMCGSGTVAIEAALMGSNTAPGLLRRNFGFMHTKLFNSDNWEKMVQKAKNDVIKCNSLIAASDIDNSALEYAQKNSSFANVADMIEFECKDFNEIEVPGGGGVVIVNPEYGMRLGEEKNLELTYRGIGNFFKYSCTGYRGFVFTANTKLAGKIGLKSRRRIQFQSGKIECRLYQYDLYEGSRK